MISIVIPTYNEKENIVRLVPGIFSQKLGKVETIIVDDGSPDGTAEEAQRLGRSFNVKVINRGKKLGLASAAATGFSKAKGEFIVLMDSDLSHPPDVLPMLISPLKTKYDLVVGSRYVPGGHVEVWPFWRRLASLVATLLARPLTKIHDPMSGFLAFRKEVIEGIDFSFKGYKIGLEILVKGRYSKVTEVPYVFRNREVGASKIGIREFTMYLLDLFGLYTFVLWRGRPKRFYKRK